MAARDESRCHLGITPNPCAWDHVAAALERGAEGTKKLRKCPVHNDRKASLSINPGHTHRIVWKCGSECSEMDIRAALLDLGVHESCLGRYGLSKRFAMPGMRIASADPVLIAKAGRWDAVDKLPADLNGKLLVMCLQAIRESGGDAAGDPLMLLPVNADDFYALADRAGIDPKYKYRLFKNWLANAA